MSALHDIRRPFLPGGGLCPPPWMVIDYPGRGPVIGGWDLGGVSVQLGATKRLGADYVSFWSVMPGGYVAWVDGAGITVKPVRAPLRVPGRYPTFKLLHGAYLTGRNVPPYRTHAFVAAVKGTVRLRTHAMYRALHDAVRLYEV